MFEFKSVTVTLTRKSIRNPHSSSSPLPQNLGEGGWGVRVLKLRPKNRLAVLIEQLPIHRNLAIGHVAQHIPMHPGLVLSARLRVACADRQVDGAAQLFVKQHVLGELLDIVVRANAQLAQVTRSGVSVQQGGYETMLGERAQDEVEDFILREVAQGLGEV